MGSYKMEQFKTTVGSAVADACGVLEELASECREIVDNAGDSGLSQTSRIQTFDQTASDLENVSEPSVPDELSDLEVVYTQSVKKSKRKGPSRATRCSNAVSLLEAARDVVQNWIDENQDTKQKDADGKELEDDVDTSDAETLVSEIEDITGSVESCEFPGMFG